MAKATGRSGLAGDASHGMMRFAAPIPEGPTTPVAPAVAPAVAPGPDEPHGPTGQYIVVQRHLLWVDDRPETSALEISTLESYALRVDIVTNTQAAMSALQRDRSSLIDTVVTTMRRREGSGSNPRAGLDLVTAMRSAGIAVPVIVYSEDVSDQDRGTLLTFPNVWVTSSFVDLLNRLGGRCAGCGKVLIGDQFFREHDRVPCPNCNATTRQFFRSTVIPYTQTS